MSNANGSDNGRRPSGEWGAEQWLLLAGEGFGEECDALVERSPLQIRRLTTPAEVASAITTAPETVRGLVVRQNGSLSACIEPLLMLRRVNRSAAVAAVITRGDPEVRRRALRTRARCIDHESGPDASWRAVRYAVVLGEKDPEQRQARIDKFSERWGLTDMQREYVDLMSRDIPFADMHHVFGVELTTKMFHFGGIRERVGVKTRDELYWHLWNQDV